MFSPLDKLYLADFIGNITKCGRYKSFHQLKYQPVGAGSPDK
jgi:hypothetical protein